MDATKIVRVGEKQIIHFINDTHRRTYSTNFISNNIVPVSLRVITLFCTYLLLNNLYLYVVLF